MNQLLQNLWRRTLAHGSVRDKPNKQAVQRALGSGSCGGVYNKKCMLNNRCNSCLRAVWVLCVLYSCSSTCGNKYRFLCNAVPAVHHVRLAAVRLTATTLLLSNTIRIYRTYMHVHTYIQCTTIVNCMHTLCTCIAALYCTTTSSRRTEDEETHVLFLEDINWAALCTLVRFTTARINKTAKYTHYTKFKHHRYWSWLSTKMIRRGYWLYPIAE
jgi:hypothetical protein